MHRITVVEDIQMFFSLSLILGSSLVMPFDAEDPALSVAAYTRRLKVLFLTFLIHGSFLRFMKLVCFFDLF